MDQINNKIIDAVIKKSKQVCPGSLALIGIYGSFATGDVHEKSDLDLLILINDERAFSLAEAFVLNDTDVGYDIYCTTWERLENDAACEHAQLSKLLDSKIIYVNDENAVHRLNELKRKARETISSDIRFEKVRAALSRAKEVYADCFLYDDLSHVRAAAGAVIYCLLDAIMLHFGSYFKLGTKRTFEELSDIGLSFDFERLVTNVICAKNVHNIRDGLTALIRAVQDSFAAKETKAKPCAENLAGTYEEIYSNWRNKMYEAAKQNDIFSSFMNMMSFHFMLQDISNSVEIEYYDVMAHFDPDDLVKSALAFDEILGKYSMEYGKIGIKPKRYENADEFIAEYLK